MWIGRTGLGLAALVLSTVSLASVADAREVRINTYGPPKHPHVVEGYTPYMAAVEEATGGSLTFKLFTGGALLGAKATPDGLRDGVADIGLIAYTYFPAEFPHIQLIADMAMQGKIAPAMAAATIEFTLLNCEPCLEEFEAHGIVHAGGHSTAAYNLIARNPVLTLEDLKGRKIRTAGSVFDRWVQAMGGVPVNIGAGEMYEALNRGQLDIVIHAPAALQTFSLWDTAEHITMLPLGTYHTIGTTAFSAKFWQSISPAERQALWDFAAMANIGPSARFEEEDKEVLDQAAEQDVSIHQPSPELVEARADFVRSDRDTTIEIAKSRYGIENPESIVETFSGLVEKWHELYAPIQDDVPKMAALLKEAVYDKIDPNEFGM